jgi:hypothetical protein
MFNFRNFAFKLLPSYIQGFIAGLLVFVSKLVIYKSNSWEFVYAPAFGLVTGLVLIVAMVIGTQTDRRHWESNGGSYFSFIGENDSSGRNGVFGFWNAFGSCIRVLMIALLLSGLADFILMNWVDVTLIEQTKNLRIEQIKNTYAVLGFDNDQIDFAINEIRQLDLASFKNMLVEVSNKLFVNGLVGLVVAAFLRRKKNFHWVDNQS